jgi:hypothetical protein
MLQQLLANQEKSETNRKADLENIKKMLEEMLRQPRWPKSDDRLQRSDRD